MTSYPCELKELERELELYRTIVQSAGDPIYVLDTEGRLTFVNDKAVELSGYDRQTLLGEPASMLMTEEDYVRCTELIRSLLSEADPRGTIEMGLCTASGDRIPCENHLTILYTEHDDFFGGTIGILRDISIRKAHEQKQQRQQKQLEAFASAVSHDLRSPLTVANIHLALAQEDVEHEDLEHVERALKRMGEMVEDLLTHALDSEPSEGVEAIDVAGLAADCWRTIPTAGATLEADGEATIRSNEKRVKQLLENLLRNAVEHGGDAVTVTVGDLTEGFFLEDDGRGIPPAKREAVFDAGYSTSTDGLGYGLSLVREIVEVHGWQIRVTDSPAGGARFEITDVDLLD